MFAKSAVMFMTQRLEILTTGLLLAQSLRICRPIGCVRFARLTRPISRSSEGIGLNNHIGKLNNQNNILI